MSRKGAGRSAINMRLRSDEALCTVLHVDGECMRLPSKLFSHRRERSKSPKRTSEAQSEPAASVEAQLPSTSQMLWTAPDRARKLELLVLGHLIARTHAERMGDQTGWGSLLDVWMTHVMPMCIEDKPPALVHASDGAWSERPLEPGFIRRPICWLKYHRGSGLAGDEDGLLGPLPFY